MQHFIMETLQDFVRLSLLGSFEERVEGFPGVPNKALTAPSPPQARSCPSEALLAPHSHEEKAQRPKLWDDTKT